MNFRTLRSTLQLVLIVAVLCVAMACKEEEKAPAVTNMAAGKLGLQDSGTCEHGVTAGLCTKCNPALAAVFQAKGDWCGEHGFPESFCPICRPGARAPDVGDPTQTVVSEQVAIENQLVRFQTKDIENTVGIETVAAQVETAKRPESSIIECTARIAFNADKLADVRAAVPGIVGRVQVELGDQVKEGDPLLVLESIRIGEVQGALEGAKDRVKTAQANFVRQQTLAENRISSIRQVEAARQELSAAEAEMRTAKTTLRIAGAAQSKPSGRYTLRAPLNGNVIRRPAVVGLLATASESLATIADTSVMWLMCDVSETNATLIKKGQKVVIVPPDPTKFTVTGEITWIAEEVNPVTRTVTTRAEVPNTQRQLRANQFVDAYIELPWVQNRISLPRSAVQRVGDLEVVFVRLEPGVYGPRVVRRFGDGDNVRVEGRIQSGDLVVTTGAVLLRTEVMPGSIGAGCCDVAPPGED